MIVFGLFLLAFLALLYFLEVISGSSLGVYNPVIGFESNCENMQKLSNKEFFTKLLPFSSFSICIPLSMYLLESLEYQGLTPGVIQILSFVLQYLRFIENGILDVLTLAKHSKK